MDGNRHLFYTLEQYRSLFLGIKKKSTESASPRSILCRCRLLCQLAQKAKESLHQIVMGQGPSRPTGSQGFQFQPSQHFLANNTCRTIQLYGLLNLALPRIDVAYTVHRRIYLKECIFQLQSLFTCHWIFPDSFSISCMSESDKHFCSVLLFFIFIKTNLENIIDLLRFVQ